MFGKKSQPIKDKGGRVPVCGVTGCRVSTALGYPEGTKGDFCPIWACQCTKRPDSATIISP